MAMQRVSDLTLSKIKLAKEKINNHRKNVMFESELSTQQVIDLAMSNLLNSVNNDEPLIDFMRRDDLSDFAKAVLTIGAHGYTSECKLAISNNLNKMDISKDLEADYIIDSFKFHYDFGRLSLNRKGRGKYEALSVKTLSSVFSIVFSDKEIVELEYALPSGKRIDALVKSKADGKITIIEAKNSTHRTLEMKAKSQVDSYKNEYCKINNCNADTLIISRNDLSLENSITWNSIGIYGEYFYNRDFILLHEDALISACYDLNKGTKVVATDGEGGVAVAYHVDVINKVIDCYL